MICHSNMSLPLPTPPPSPIPPYHSQDKLPRNRKDLPLRLFDCLGFTIPLCFFGVGLDLWAEAGLRLGGGGGSGAGFRTGEVRKAVGDGMVIVSIVRVSCTDEKTSTFCGNLHQM